MNPLVVAMGLMCALCLTATAISLFALHRAQLLVLGLVRIAPAEEVALQELHVVAEPRPIQVDIPA